MQAIPCVKADTVKRGFSHVVNVIISDTRSALFVKRCQYHDVDVYQVAWSSTEILESNRAAMPQRGCESIDRHRGHANTGGQGQD